MIAQTAQTRKNHTPEYQLNSADNHATRRTLVDPNATPRELWQYRQYVSWKYVDRGAEKPDKVPVNPRTLGNAGVTWPSTWSDIRNTVRVYQANEDLAGIGFVLTDHDPYVMIDLDNCIHDNQLSPLAEEVVYRLNTYTEVSPSQTGLRLFIYHEGAVTLKRDTIEIYYNGRWATLTGNVLHQRPIARVESLDWLLTRFTKPGGQGGSGPTTPAFAGQPASGDDAELWRRICRHNQLAMALYNGDTSQARGDDSRAVMLLLNSLALWTKGDPARMRRMMEQTALDKTKWSSKRGDQDWLTGRIQDAINYMGGRAVQYGN